MDTIEVEGLRIAYERVGVGPPLVLLHAVLGDSRLLTQQLNELFDEFTVVPQCRAFGGAAGNPSATARPGPPRLVR